MRERLCFTEIKCHRWPVVFKGLNSPTIHLLIRISHFFSIVVFFDFDLRVLSENPRDRDFLLKFPTKRQPLFMTKIKYSGYGYKVPERVCL